MKATRLSLTIAALALLGACGTESQNPGAPGPELLPQTQAISECGGLKPYELSQIIQPAPASYCDAEVLRWAYDAQAGTLVFSNERISLNCCGTRSIKLTEAGGEYLLKEVDSPEQAGRCDCMCVYDLQVEAQQIPGGTIQLRLVREVTDDGGAQTLYTGAIDLSAGSGTIVIDSASVFDASGRCMPTP